MELLILVVLILLNGFFALSEIALVSSKQSRLEQKKAEGSKGAETALRLLTNSETFLSAIQVGITLIGIVTGVYGGMKIADDLSPYIQNIAYIGKYANEIALTLTVLIITFVSIVIGELVPKTIALSNPETIATRVAPVIFYFSRVFYPFVRMLSISTNFINSLIGIKKQTEQLTEAELRQMIKIASNEGVIEKEQNVLHEKIFYFADKKAKHLMTHRTDVEWINIVKPTSEIKELLLKCQHSRIVCCKGSLDNFKGILNLKDFFKTLALNEKPRVEDIIYRPLILSESTDAQKVLTLLRKNKTHICCVVNEFGGFEGLITLHDIIENIVGQIPDEGEIYEPDVFIRADKSVLVSGDAPIETLSEIMHGFTVDFEKINYSTVAGFVLDQIGNIPQIGDTFDYTDYQIEIIDIDKNKIDKVLITKISDTHQ
jgi:putative hemolysin